jgi:hypothetical protein
VFLFLLTVIALVSLAVSAVSYFFAKTKILLFAFLVFYATNFFLSFFLFYDFHLILFIAITTLFLAFPVSCIVIFSLDTFYALFCTDTSFVFVIVWLLMPIFFIINLISYIITIVHA